MVFRDRVAPESGPLSRRAAYEFVKRDLYGRAFYLNVNNTVPYPVRGRYRGNIDGEPVESGDLDCTATALAGTQAQFSSAVRSMAESVSRMADSYKDLNDDGTEFKIGTRIYERFHRDGQINRDKESEYRQEIIKAKAYKDTKVEFKNDDAGMSGFKITRTDPSGVTKELIDATYHKNPDDERKSSIRISASSRNNESILLMLEPALHCAMSANAKRPPKIKVKDSSDPDFALELLAAAKVMGFNAVIEHAPTLEKINANAETKAKYDKIMATSAEDLHKEINPELAEKIRSSMRQR